MDLSIGRHFQLLTLFLHNCVILNLMKKNATDQKIRKCCHEDMNIQGVIVKESYE